MSALNTANVALALKIVPDQPDVRAASSTAGIGIKSWPAQPIDGTVATDHGGPSALADAPDIFV
jgi:hypothetical protein